MKKRVAHILPWPAVGGTEHATLRIAEAVRDSYDSVAFCVKDGDEVKDLFRQSGFPTVDFDIPEPSFRHALRFYRASRRLADQFRAQKIDLVHCADFVAGYSSAFAGRLAKLPVLCHIRNRFADVSWRDSRFLAPVDKFAFVSKDTWTRFGMDVADKRGTVIYDGIAVNPAGSTPADRAAARAELNVGDRLVYGMVARVAEQKDYRTLAFAARQVLARNPNARFLVVGDNATAQLYREHFAKVQAWLKEAGVSDAFIFTGARSDVPRLIAAMDFFVLSTHHEGLPLVILEAMAQGKPVVATDVDGVPEVVHDGVTGLLHPHEDDRRLAECLLALDQDPARASKMGEAGRELVRTQFSREQFAQSMKRFYDQALGVAQ